LEESGRTGIEKPSTPSQLAILKVKKLQEETLHKK
jgi:hypothetical protein